MNKKIMYFLAIALFSNHLFATNHKNRVGKEDDDFMAKSAVDQFRILRKKYGVPSDSQHSEGTVKVDENADVDQTRRRINILLNQDELELKDIDNGINDLDNYLKTLNEEKSWPDVEAYRDLVKNHLRSSEEKDVRSKNKDAQEKKNDTESDKDEEKKTSK